MLRLVGVVAVLLCVLVRRAQNNIAPPGWKGFGPTTDPAVTTDEPPSGGGGGVVISAGAAVCSSTTDAAVTPSC